MMCNGSRLAVFHRTIDRYGVVSTTMDVVYLDVATLTFDAAIPRFLMRPPRHRYGDGRSRKSYRVKPSLTAGYGH